MRKLTLLLILLIGSLSYGQEPIIIYQNAPDRQKITEFEKRNDSLVISLENSGTNKVYIGDIAGVALGETSITAYRGDRGKTAYDHTSLSNNPHSVTKSQVGLGNVDNTSDANKPISTLTQTALNAKANINSPTFTGNVSVPTATISDAAVNLGQMMDSLATIEVGSGVTSQYMDSDKTLEQSDFGKYIYTDTSIELTIDNTPAVSSKIGLKVIDIDEKITVLPDGVTFTGDGQDISQGFIVDSLNLATVFKLASNLYSVDGVYKPYVSPGPFMDPAFVAGFWAEDLGADESLVETWTDRTGNGNNASQATSANRPKVNIEADGKKAVDFDGTNDGLSITEVTALNFTPGDPISIVLVTGQKAFSTDTFPLFKGNTSSSTTGVEYGFYSTGAENLRGNVYGSVGSISGARTGVDVWIVVSDGTTASFYLNGTIVGSSWAVGTADISSSIWIGNRLGAAKYFDGSIRAVGIANTALDAGQLITINGYDW